MDRFDDGVRASVAEESFRTGGLLSPGWQRFCKPQHSNARIQLGKLRVAIRQDSNLQPVELETIGSRRKFYRRGQGLDGSTPTPREFFRDFAFSPARTLSSQGPGFGGYTWVS
jgi:hypothetical protein